MADHLDDDELLARLRDVLQPTIAEPSEEGVDAVRRRAASAQPTVLRRSPRAWLLAAAVLVLVVGIGAVVIITTSSDDGRREVAESAQLIAARRAADQLDALLAQPSPDLAAVAAADEQLRQAVDALPEPERPAVAARAAQLHAAAAAVLTPPQRVSITAVTPNPDGTYRVDFEVVGFAPAADGYQVNFSFDDPTVEQFPYAGPSPWGFDEGAGQAHDTICATVIDTVGNVVPKSGACQPIPKE